MHYRTFVSRDSGRRRFHPAVLPAARASADSGPGSPGNQYVAAPFPWGGRGQKGPSTVWESGQHPLRLSGLSRNPNLPSFILPWWTPDCRDFGLKKGKRKKKKVWAFQGYLKGTQKTDFTYWARRGEPQVINGCVGVQCLTEFKLYPWRRKCVVQKPWIMVLLLKWPAR